MHRATPTKETEIMEKLDQISTTIFFRLIQDIDDQNCSKRFDLHSYWPKCNGGIMAVHVEKIEDVGGYPSYSVAHYYKQNGDLMSDPEMTFVVVGNHIIPISFTQHSLGVFEESVIDAEGGWMVKQQLHRNHVAFANHWMKNIKDQQDLV